MRYYKLKIINIELVIGFKGKRFDLGTYSNFESALEIEEKLKSWFIKLLLLLINSGI